MDSGRGILYRKNAAVAKMESSGALCRMEQKPWTLLLLFSWAAGVSSVPTVIVSIAS
ncbi:hypothetical protein SB48_HM08orf06392 [Heyndrickxia coagulans]|uniref:Uncharacterized protein n=1 Tax=Heyndrickxia coagulans TaxID=1398 RepID=A0AAN0TA66_HEYCO|nr:hypothetical protein SB48_HM08orf06392 [Heyndrickxia coagulans]